MFGERTLGSYAARHPLRTMRSGYMTISGLKTVGGVDMGPILAQATQDVQNVQATSQPGGEVNAVMGGLGALDNFLTKMTTEPGTVRARMTKDWNKVRAALQIAKTIPDPITQVAAHVAELFVNIAYELFGDKPCEFEKKGNCSATIAADGSRSGGGVCCNPFPGSSGRGVVVTLAASGYKRFPGKFNEIPAGNYYNIAGSGVPRDQMVLRAPSANQIRRDMYKFAPRMFQDNHIHSMLVPNGWAVEIFDKSGFQGKRQVLGPGFHNVADMGWADKISSMRVRGPWSIHDRLYSEAFKGKTAGWITERARKTINPDMILALTGLDPLRPKQPGYQPYDSVWRPGWYLRLSEAGALNSQVVQMVFQELGFTPQDLEREKMISMEKTLNTVKLLFQTSAMNSPAQAAELLQNAFTMEQLEIAKLLSRYGLDGAMLQKLYSVLGQQLAALKKKLGVSATEKVWRKPRFDITQVALTAN